MKQTKAKATVTRTFTEQQAIATFFTDHPDSQPYPVTLVKIRDEWQAEFGHCEWLSEPDTVVNDELLQDFYGQE